MCQPETKGWGGCRNKGSCVLVVGTLPYKELTIQVLLMGKMSLTSPIVIRELTKLFHVVSRQKCVVTVEELNWYESVGSVAIERELKIHRHVLTPSTEP